MKKNVEVWILRFGCFLLMVVTSAILNPNTAFPQSGKILENVFTLELRFGAENLPNEYLLASPRDCIAADNGDIIVADEFKLKIFDKNGKPKKILGGRGQGPGKFSYSSIYLMFPKNGMLVGLQSNIYNLYASDYSFIEMKNLQQSNYRNEIQKKFSLNGLFFSQVYCYTQKEFLLFSSGNRITQMMAGSDEEIIDISELSENESRKYFYFLTYHNGTDMKILMADSVELSGVSERVKGGFYYQILPNYRWLYTNMFSHKIEKNKIWYYSLFIYDVKTQKPKEITHTYTPAVIPDSVINRRIPPEFAQEEKKRSDELKKIKYCAPLQEVLADGNFIFAITYTYEKGKGYLTDVFDTESGAYLKSVYFSIIPKQIQNGYA